MEAIFVKHPNGLVPATEDDAELLGKLKLGQGVKMKFTRVRNLNFHRKFFALMRLGYDFWGGPAELDKASFRMKALLDEAGITPEKSFDGFRQDVVILAGHYDAYYRLNGEVRLEAKSIAFGSMDEDEFEALYSKVIDVILKRVCTQYTEAELRKQVEDMVLAFA